VNYVVPRTADFLFRFMSLLFPSAVDQLEIIYCVDPRHSSEVTAFDEKAVRWKIQENFILRHHALAAASEVVSFVLCVCLFVRSFAVKMTDKQLSL